MDSQNRLCRVGFVFLLFLIARPAWSQNESALWQPTGGPLGGDIHVLASDPGQAVLLASDGTKLFQHDGTRWTLLEAPSETITALHIAPAGRYFLAVSRPRPDKQHAKLSSILSSDDGGVTWTPAGLTDLEGEFTFITRSPAGVLFAGGLPGLYRLEEDGTTWTNVTPTGGHGALVAEHLRFTEDGTLFTVSSGLSVHRSKNGGDTWTVQHDYVTDTGVASLAIDEGGALFAGMSNMGDNFYIERSVDDGQTWERLTASSFPTVALLAHEGTLLAGTLGGGLLQSHNQGETWEELNLPARYVRALVAGSGASLFAGTSQGVYASPDDGASWTFLGTGMRAFRTTSLLAHTDGSLLAGTLSGGLFRSDDGLTWERLELPAIHVRTLLETDTHLLVGTQQKASYAL
ncbi:MAG TPA: hypothetical protein VKP65_10820, partial [Rhodothermales bacterium]|nr:hypothetical protein [Rhodothermales bacterium]